MRKPLSSLLLILITLANFSYAEIPYFYQEESVSEPVTARLIAEESEIKPGRPFLLGVHLKMEEGWHAYWKNPGSAGMPPQVKWILPDGFQLSAMEFPTPKKFVVNSAIGYGYEDEVTLIAKINSPEVLSGKVEIGAEVSWVVCNESSCLPGGTKVTTTLSVSDAPKSNTEHGSHFKAVLKRLPIKHPSISAYRKDKLITLHIPTGHKAGSVRFFPYDSEHINDEVEAVLLKDKGDPHAWNVVIQEHETDRKEKFLKGIVALYSGSPDEDIIETYEVQVTIEDTDSNYFHETIAAVEPLAASAPKALEQYRYKGGLAMAMALAFAGGLLLNLMPCVLPVLSFKVLSFVKMAGQNRNMVFRHGVAFSLGVLLSFWALAGVLLALQAYGKAVGWGFQLQVPLFVAILASVIFVFGLSMFGVFEIGTGFASLAGQAQTTKQKNGGLTGSFFSGILATAVATPCTGPFLGTAVGFAVTLPALQALLIFSALGLGMAFPYLLLGTFPSLLRFLPKPGNWMIVFKEAMGFVMVATVLWLLWVFGAQTDTAAMVYLLTGLLFLSIGCWIFGKWGAPLKRKNVRMTSFAFTLATFLIGGSLIYQASTLHAHDGYSDIAMLTEKQEAGWEKFSPERVAALRAEGIPVFIDFTAKWCLICQTNHAVLNLESVKQEFDKLGVVRMIADWTRSDDTIGKELAKFGRNSVPLYLLYDGSPENDPAILPQVLTPEIVIEALRKI